MVDANVVVILGPPSSDSYYIGVGRRVCHNNLPRTLVESIESGELSNITLNYISLDKDGKYWCSEEMIGPSLTYEVPSGSQLHQKIRAVGAGGSITFPDYDAPDSETEPWFFAASKRAGSWSASLPDFYVNVIKTLRTDFPQFDGDLEGVIFGKGGTHIYQFSHGFIANLEGEHDKDDNKLNQTLKSFDRGHNPSIQPGEWVIEKGSVISLHDYNHFFLIFKNTRTGSIEYKFNLPSHLDAKFRELWALSKTASEQRAIEAEHRRILSQAQARANDVLRSQGYLNSLNNAANMTMLQGGLSFANAAGGAQYEYVPKY